MNNEEIRKRLAIPSERLDAVNALLLDPDSRVVDDLLRVVARYGTPEEINRKAERARQLDYLLDRVRATEPAFLKELDWLSRQRDEGAFVSVADYRRKILGPEADTMKSSGRK